MQNEISIAHFIIFTQNTTKPMDFPNSKKYVLLLRGINVGGNKKVPMAELKKALAALGFENIKTLLNSGNVVFETEQTPENKLVEKINAL